MSGMNYTMTLKTILAKIVSSATKAYRMLLRLVNFVKLFTNGRFQQANLILPEKFMFPLSKLVAEGNTSQV